jgi:hypothetical protein
MCYSLAGGRVEQSHNRPSKPTEKEGGRQAADRFSQLPVRGFGSAAIICTEHQSKRRAGIALTICLPIEAVSRLVNLGLGKATKSVIARHPRGIARGTPNRQIAGH